MGLANNLDDLDKFVLEMKQKLIDVEWKHPQSIDKSSFKELKLHLIDEFCEVFYLDTEKKKLLFDLLEYDEYLDNIQLDFDELKDLANMCFALKLFYNIKNKK